MKQLQRLFAAFVLVCALSFNATADGIIQTGTPPPPPPPSPTSMTAEEPEPVEIAEDEASVLDAAAAFALELLRGTLTLF